MKVSLGTVALVVLGMAAPASAADLAARPYTKAPPPPPVAAIYDWTGFYIGANGGWAQSHNCLDFLTVTGAIVRDACSDNSGGVAGLQLGYRWQAASWVFGLEAQGDWADISRTRVSLLDPALSTTAKIDGIGLFTGQIGYAWNAALLYVKGGAAVTSNSLSVFDNNFGIAVFSASSTRWGGTVGVGWEYGFAPNWSLGIEYDHLFMGDANNSFTARTNVATFLNNRVSQDVDMVTFRVNYRFGGYGYGAGYGAPGVSRY
jgi:outer membrane immunogenic protein